MECERHVGNREEEREGMWGEGENNFGGGGGGGGLASQANT